MKSIAALFIAATAHAGFGYEGEHDYFPEPIDLCPYLDTGTLWDDCYGREYRTISHSDGVQCVEDKTGFYVWNDEGTNDTSET